ncbi:RNA recognition domain-containing protein [Colletotrichum sublineola]|uniref:Putative RNA recognition domain-containing protein n=1 Tax=Colletotrichum sublineola TaxID=1173701 RepID=A0A066XQW8_COLSU|nr:RNA recognition domain-containing protein [Colletotrichum sublineola]KDN68390.1 putative RNA recognition domain-containing protein [Colletotrichum sublineola]
MSSPGKPLKRSRAEEDEHDALVAAAVAENLAADSAAEPKAKKARTEANRSLFVRSLPATATSESLTDFFSEHFPVKHATVVLDKATKTSRGYGFVTLTDAEDAMEAKKKLNNMLWEGRRIRVDVAEARHRDGKESAVGAAAAGQKQKRTQELEDARKPPKLIIRNLPWSIKTSEQLGALFRAYGIVKFADLPQNKGKLKGFGFVTLRGRKNAEKALEMNGKVIDGRPIAVDWAVDKSEWDQVNGTKEDPEDDEKPKSKKQKKDATEEEDEAIKDDKAGEEPQGADADLENFMKNHMMNLEDEEDSDQDENEDEDEDEELDLSEDDEEGATSDTQNDKNSVKKTPTSTDNTSTLFIRNLPFTVTDDQLKEHFVKFGPVRYARVVMDRATDRPAGTGFVCFVNEEDAKACIKGAPRPQPSALPTKHSVLQDESADQDGRYTLDGRLLQVAQAVSKDDAERLAADGSAKRREKDKRRLFLLNEGQIDTRSSLYHKLTPNEIKMREDSAKQRKKLVQSNPTLHISLTRLAIRNIPRNIGSKELKELARKACVEFAKDVKEGKRQSLSKEEKVRDAKEAKNAEHERKLKRKGIVRQAKIEFESREGTKVPEASGGKSRGYGFIEYSSHRWALMGLRFLNGYQLENELGKKQRLIVEFAIENASVVARRKANEKNLDRNRQNAQSAKDGQNAKKGGAEGKELPTMASFKDKKGKKKGNLNKGRKEEPEAKPEKAGKADSKKPVGKVDRKDVKPLLIARKRLMRKKKASSRG